MKPHPLFSLLLFICLAACSQGSPAATPTVPSPLETPSVPAPATETPVPPSTNTPKPTDTLPPTATFTPSETATPDVAKLAAVTAESFRNFDYNTGFMRVTHEQALGLNDDIVSGKALQLANIDSIEPATLYDTDGIQVWISATIGVNLFPLFAIAEPGTHGIQHNVLFAIVVKDPVSGKNTLKGLKISFVPQYLKDDGTEMRITKGSLAKIANLTRVEIHLVTRYPTAIPSISNPVINDVLVGTDPVRQRLQQRIVDDETGTVAIWERGFQAP